MIYLFDMASMQIHIQRLNRSNKRMNEYYDNYLLRILRSRNTDSLGLYETKLMQVPESVFIEIKSSDWWK